jgi:transcriptional regulator with XRE-family HTH domain
MLREWRNEHGISLDELSDVTGLSPSMLSRVERGQRSLDALARIRLARMLGVRVRDIFPAKAEGETVGV